MVNVRFVPRGVSQAAYLQLASVPTELASDMVQPTKREMEKGRRRLLDRGVASEASALNRLVASVDEAKFREMFDVGLERVPSSTVSERTLTSSETFERPTGALKVPEPLQDTVAFAYVPRPVEYHAPLPYPPHESIYHLRLSEVALALNAVRAHQKGTDGTGTRVAMADSGFWLHPWFIRSGFSLLPTPSPGSGDPTVDESGHGTGEAANIFAVAPRTTVLGVKQGSSSAGTLEACVALDPHVMTNSWGWSIDNRTRDRLRADDPGMYAEVIDIESVIRSAVAKGIAVVFSAGNGHLAFPACLPEVIAVGGVTLNEDGSLEASSYASGFDSKLYPGRSVPDVCGIVGRGGGSGPLPGHIMLPVPRGSALDGENFPSGTRDTGWGIFSGTSAAAPQVAGIIALMRQLRGNLAPAQIRSVLEAHAVDVTKGRSATGARAKEGKDLATGAGLADALRSCGYLEGA